MSKLTGDALWNLRKQQANKIANLYSQVGCKYEYDKIRQCATQLKFVYAFPDYEGAAILQRLVAANFCRLRHCPICQWRRSLRWMARTFQVLPKIFQAHPSHRWLFLTLTIKNCPLDELRSHIDTMNSAFRRWTKEKDWVAHGWLKSIEVSRAADNSAHPHIHCLLLVRYDNQFFYAGQPIPLESAVEQFMSWAGV